MLIVALVLVNAAVSRLDRIPRFHKLFGAEPAVIVKDGKYLTAVMQREGVSQKEVEMSMREHGVADIKDVQLGVLEPDGSISVVPLGNATKTKRRVLFHHRAG